MNLSTTLAAPPAAVPPATGPAQRWLICLVLAAVAVCLPARARAFSSGEASEGCNGCHGGGMAPTVLITSDLTTFNPGQTITLTISISQTNGPVAGFYIESNGVGKFSIVDSGTKLGGTGVTHNAPRTGSGGTTIFKVGWTAPATAGGVDFYVWANSANGDGKSSGDAEGDGFFSTAFGCAGNKYYHDFDGDGVGAESSGYTIACSVPQYYSAQSGDCDDNDPKVYAGAPEICDHKDNNCNGQIDEGLPIMTYCTDNDGDGHGVTGKATIMGCAPSNGFGLCDNDCDDNDPSVYPGAPELCNGKDDNCNGQVDEGARTICGVGWCARYADGCSSSLSSCTPGAPRPEECNDFDDDCDGVKDNGTDLELCKLPGLACRGGYCVPAASAGAGGSGAVSGGGASSASGAASQPTQAAQSGSANSAGADATHSPSPPGCALGRAPRRQSLAGLGLALGAAALLRRKHRRGKFGPRARLLKP